MAKPEARHNLTPGRNCGETGIARSPGTYLLCSAASGTASLHPKEVAEHYLIRLHKAFQGAFRKPLRDSSCKLLISVAQIQQLRSSRKK